MDVPSKVLPDKKDDIIIPAPQAEKAAEPKAQVKTSEEPAKAAPRTDEEKGARTPEHRLYAALEEERRMRKEEELRRKELELELARVQERDVHSQPSALHPAIEDDELRAHIERLEGEIFTIKRTTELEKVYQEFPDLAAHADEFSEFRKDYPGIELRKVAKFFLIDKGVTGTSRKGLLEPSGGARVAPQPTLSKEDVKRLRETEPRRYLKLIREGKIKAEDVK